MLDQEISKALIKRIFANIGFGTNNALLETNNILSKKLRIQEEDNSINEYIVFAGECSYLNSDLKAIIVNISSDDNDFVLFFYTLDTLISLRYSLKENDCGIFLTRNNDEWVDMSILQRLNLASATELIAQNGYYWTPVTDQDKAFEIVSNYLAEE